MREFVTAKTRMESPPLPLPLISFVPPRMLHSSHSPIAYRTMCPPFILDRSSLFLRWWSVFHLIGLSSSGTAASTPNCRHYYYYYHYYYHYYLYHYIFQYIFLHLFFYISSPHRLVLEHQRRHVITVILILIRISFCAYFIASPSRP